MQNNSENVQWKNQDRITEICKNKKKTTKIYRTLKENVFTVKEQQLYMEDVFQSRVGSVYLRHELKLVLYPYVKSSF